jgi:hypothetical protein
MEAQLPMSSRRAAMIIIGGCTALIGFGLASLVGYPGTGIALVPFGVLMIVLGGIEFILSRLG